MSEQLFELMDKFVIREVKYVLIIMHIDLYLKIKHENISHVFLKMFAVFMNTIT